ncbi:hypothetical protein VE04_03495 [Pseudogymnoascus sp. 24MN13]|uniref:DNA replication complex GINS protein PSF3 n=1 Tax=Pseudogymnoascus verrucosus TaxID=342668 RepID=A0A1B8GF43_9PEZI|nr:DNA replication protein [Pseudogymnoascus verrucosus]OBT56375.1 hypothetical protein VE04_03495 [Pseudogymnoascus sp. 24MN13]OBT94437.1 DNA replication protein [Pseudogymnoascus verrucosus]
MSYYDVDAILTDAQKIPCHFTLAVPGLGHLDASSTPMLKASTPLSLPLWLAETVALNSPTPPKPVLSLDLPEALSPTVIAALKAAPTAVDLRAQAPYFFALAARLLALFDDEPMLAVLQEAFKKRSGEIVDHASNVGGRSGAGVAAEAVEFLRGLDEEERKLFRVAHESAKAAKAWLDDEKR